MVSTSVIKRLADAVDTLEERYKAKRAWKTVFITHERAETAGQALARHIADHPEDEDADVVISTYYESKPGDFERARDLAASKTERLRLVAERGAYV